MTTVSPHGLICLDDGDYAAVPLMLQANKTTINDTLTAQATALTAYNTPNLYVNTLAANLSSICANCGTPLSDGTLVTTFNNIFRVFPKGWWCMVGSATFQEIGTVNVGSYRRLGVWASITNNFYDITDLYDTVAVATNSGQPDSLNAAGWFYSDGVTAHSCQMVFAHGNTSSNLNVLAGARLTVQYLGTGATL